MIYFNVFASTQFVFKMRCQCDAAIYTVFCFLFVLCWCGRRRQAKDQRSWNCALKILPVPLGGCWAEIKIKMLCRSSLYVAEDLVSEEFPHPFRKLRLTVFKKKKTKGEKKRITIASFLKAQAGPWHFMNYDLDKKVSVLCVNLSVISARPVLGPWLYGRVL